MRAADIPDYQATRITTATTTAVKASSGVVRGIVVGATAAGTVTINDASGAKLVLGASFPVGYHGPLDFICTGKIEVVTGAASDLTILWR